MQALLVFDADSDQNLNRAEFSRFINAFCEGCETDFNSLSEFLILLAAMEDSPSEELAFLVIFLNLRLHSLTYLRCLTCQASKPA